MGFTQKARKAIGRWIDGFLRGHRNHYACLLPKDWGLLSFASILLKSVFSQVTTNPTQTTALKRLQKEGIIIYATKYKSNFEYLCYHMKYKDQGTPFPQIGFEYNMVMWQRFSQILRMGLARLDRFFRRKGLPDPYESEFFKEQLLSGKAGLLSLVDRKGFYHRFVKSKHDPLKYLLELQKETTRPIYIVPQWLLFGKKPKKTPMSIVDVFFGTEENPGPLRRWVSIFFKPEKAFIEISQPLSLAEFLSEPINVDRTPEQMSFALRQQLLDQMNRHFQSITGPPLKTRDELKEQILRNERFRTFLEDYAKKGKKDLAALHRKADAALDEIAADYSPRLIQFLGTIFGWVWKTMFEGIALDMEGLSQVKRSATRGPVVFVPCHRSHFDYLILPYLLMINNMPCPHVAAGQNLAFWPMGTLFRKSGAFFIRRSFHGALLYARVFSEYVTMLIKQGFNIEFFIEGGRSRTGKMVLPKTGFLTILMDTYKDGMTRDIIFAPVAVGYDQLLEEDALLSEVEGKKKRQESLRQLMGIRKLIKKRHGRVYVQFSTPLSLADLSKQSEKPLNEMSHAEYQALGRNLAHRIINAINEISVVTAQALVAAAVLNYPKQSFSRSDLVTYVETYLDYLDFQNARFSANLDDTAHGIDMVLNIYSNRKFIERQKTKAQDENHDREPRYVTAENKRLSLEYYKNNCIHHFIPAAYASLAILSYDAFQFSASVLHGDYKFLQEFFKYEFAYNVDQTPEYMVRKTIKAFINEAILIPHPTLPDTYNITSKGFRKLLLFAAFLKTYFESYWVVLNVLKRYGRRELVKKQRVKKIVSLGKQFYRAKEIERREALSSVNYENGLAFFNFKGIRGKEDREGLDFYSEVIKRYLRCFMVEK